MVSGSPAVVAAVEQVEALIAVGICAVFDSVVRLQIARGVKRARREGETQFRGTERRARRERRTFHCARGSILPLTGTVESSLLTSRVEGDHGASELSQLVFTSAAAREGEPGGLG